MTQTGLNVLPFLALNATDGVETEEVGHFDDGVSHTIHIRNGFPFGTSLHTFAFVSQLCIVLYWAEHNILKNITHKRIV